MNRISRRMLKASTAAGVVALAVGLGRRAGIKHIRAQVNPDLDRLFELPDDVEHHDVETHDGGSIHVIERGTGRPLVLVHGVTLGAEVWAPILHLAADRFRVIAIDVRGHGASVVGSDGVGRVAAAHDLATLLEHLDLRDAIVCGHSMGGMILGQMCGDFPQVARDRVAGLVFMDTAVSNMFPRGTVRAINGLGAALLKRSDAGRPFVLPGRADDELLFTRVAFGRRPSAAAVEVTRRLGHDVSDEYRTRLWVDLFDTDNRVALGSVEQPSLVLVGSADALTPVWVARRIVSHLRNGELRVFPGAGHQLMQERPFEVVEAFEALEKTIESTGNSASSNGAEAPSGV